MDFWGSYPITGSPVEGIGNERIDGRIPNSPINMMFCGAGFRPGRRGPFVSAKGPKTIDALSDLMRGDGRQPVEGGQLARPKQGPPVDESVPPKGQTAGVDHKIRTFRDLSCKTSKFRLKDSLNSS